MIYPYLLPSLVVLHLTALILMAGVTLMDYIQSKAFWKLAGADRMKALGVLEASASFSRMAGIGAAMLIVTGLLMMAVTHGIFGEQTWFRIKFALVILLVVNSIFIGRKQALLLRKRYSSRDTGSLDGIQKNIRRFHLSQLSLFILIIILSVFKFN